MACVLTAGRLLDCKDYIGGIRTILFQSVADYSPTYTGNVLSAIVADTLMRYELAKGIGSFTETIQSSPENGTIFYEGAVNIKLHKLSATDRDEIKLLVQNRLVIYILDNNDNQWVIGEKNGAELSAGTGSTGAALGDLNGYDLTFTSQEGEPMRNAGAYTTNPFDNITNSTISPAY
jgi:hypothetical protein